MARRLSDVHSLHLSEDESINDDKKSQSDKNRSDGSIPLDAISTELADLAKVNVHQM